MKSKEINRIYTETVAALIAKGYQIHTATMSGSQGEIAHIDLTDGKEILRVLLNREGFYDDSPYSDRVTLTVGRCTDELRVRGFRHGYATIWNDRLEILFEIAWVEIDEDWFVTPEEAKPLGELRFARWKRRSCRSAEYHQMPDAYKPAALRWLKKQPRMKSCKIEDITKLTKVTYSDGFRYEIEAKGKTFYLHA